MKIMFSVDKLKAFSFKKVDRFLQVSGNHKPDPRLSYVEGARDVAILEAMLESGTKQGAVVPVKKF